MGSIAYGVGKNIAKRIKPFFRVSQCGRKHLSVRRQDIAAYRPFRNDILPFYIIGIVNDLRAVIVDKVDKIPTDGGK